jgi:ABC-type glycerol-3-phosphate transport system substrate-binding protein
MQETELAPSGPIILKIWLPPEFDPANGSPASVLLQSRLEEFSARRDNVRIETRIKDVAGPGGIVDTLTTASAAAPLALPDLVALPHDALQSAALAGLLHPYDGLSEVMDDPDWYDFARQLSHVQTNTFGIPFAGDALIMVYRPTTIEDVPADWTTLLEAPEPLTFPAASPNALLTLTFYQASGGAIAGDEGQPLLELTPLTNTLTFYQQATRNAVLPYWLTQYETDEQAWLAFEEKQAAMAVTWASRYLQSSPEDTAISYIPTPDGIPFTTATGWAWALASPDPERQALSAELAEFLAISDYAAEWAKAAGYLPPRPSGLTPWENSPSHTILNQICASAQIAPSDDLLAILGVALQKSTVDVLKDQTDPVTLAQEAIDSLIVP